MKKPLFRFVLSLTFVFTFLLAGQGQGYGYVWCLGEDGHTRIEHATGGVCGDGHKADTVLQGETNSITTSFLAADEHCGPCRDLPAYCDTLQNRAPNGQDLSAQPLPLALVQAPTPPVFIRILTANLIPNPPPRLDDTILFLRTVVLLN